MPLYKRYWAATPEERREQLMPFFWGTLMATHGSIAGNAARGSRVHLTNGHWFSYPGIFRDPGWPRSRRHHQEQRSDPQSLSDGAGVSATAQRGEGEAWRVRVVERLQRDRRTRAGGPRGERRLRGIRFTRRRDPASERVAVRDANAVGERPSRRLHDAVRDGLPVSRSGPACSISRSVKPTTGRTTDATIGAGRVHAAPTSISKQLWSWLQSQPEYKERTSLLITTDHGRGITPADWRDHGKDVKGASEIWMAFVSPQMAKRGEWSAHAPITASQSAATLIQWMGLDWQQFAGAAPPVQP